MNFLTQTSKAVSNILLRPSLTILVLLIGAQVAYSFQNTIVGVLIDVKSETGKQQRRAMQIAAQSFNNYSQNHNINLFFRDFGGIPLQAASSAEELIIKKKIEVILVMGTWQEASLVADSGNKAQIPTISFSSPPIIPPLMQHRWPFLIQTAKDQAAHMNCIADIIREFNWQKVIAIYEDNPYSGDSGMLSLFSEALQRGDSQIENRLRSRTGFSSHSQYGRKPAKDTPTIKSVFRKANVSETVVLPVRDTSLSIEMVMGLRYYSSSS